MEFELFGEMQRKGLEPDVGTLTAAIQAYEKDKRPKKALQLFEVMQQGCMEPKVITSCATLVHVRRASIREWS